MPRYQYACDACEHEFETFQHIRSEPMIRCPECGKPRLQRVPQMCGTLNREYKKPIEAFSIALDTEEEIDAFRDRNPGTDISRDRRHPLFGVPVLRSRAEKLRVYKREGMIETN